MSSLPDQAERAAAAARLDAMGVRTDERVFRACFMGNLSPRLELPVVIDAARRLAATHPEIQFVIAGQGQELAPLEARAAGLPNVVLPGWLGAADLVTLMERSDVGLLPYPNEPDLTKWPTNKVGEYFSRALPIVSSVPGEVAHLLATHQCGVTYRNGDAGELAGTLARLAGDRPAVAAMSERAAALFDAQFKGEVVYNRFADFIETLARSRSAHAPAAHRPAAERTA